MGENHFKILKAEILQELDTLKQLTEDCITFYKENKNNLDSSSNLRVIGSILHDFYTCVEKMFRNIAFNIDEELPNGPSWHTNLLDRMTLSIPSVRKKVINDKLKAKLYDYLRFRHIFRNVYGFDLNWDKMNQLVCSMEKVYQDLKNQMMDFLKFLEELP
jgi:hypothetical protein